MYHKSIHLIFQFNDNDGTTMIHQVAKLGFIHNYLHLIIGNQMAFIVLIGGSHDLVVKNTILVIGRLPD